MRFAHIGEGTTLNPDNDFNLIMDTHLNRIAPLRLLLDVNIIRPVPQVLLVGEVTSIPTFSGVALLKLSWVIHGSSSVEK